MGGKWRKFRVPALCHYDSFPSDPQTMPVMLFDVEIGFVIQQPVEHVCGVPHGGANELDVEWGVLVRDVSVERRARLVARQRNWSFRRPSTRRTQGDD